MDRLLNTEIWDGRTLGDILTVEFLASVLGDVVAALVILFLGFVIAGWAKRRIVRLTERHEQLDKTLFSFLGNIIRYTIVGLAFLIVLNTLGVQTTSVIAVIGAAGLAIGLALQGTLSNIAAGVMIVFFRPLRVGDFVEVGGQMGSVKEVTLNYVELDTIGNVRVIVPNAQVWGDTIVNYSVNALRRAEWTFGVAYGADLKTAETTIIETIMADPRSMSEPAPFIQVNNLGDFSVDFLVRVWVPAADFFAYQADMKRQVKEALDAAGVEIPFPTRTVFQSGTAA